MQYQWKRGWHFTADADKIGHELEGMTEAKTAAAIVEFARNESTELHKCFEWDDTLAAAEYRMVQARKVMQKIVIVREVEPPGEEKRTITVRAYECVNVTPNATTETRNYVPVDQALSVPNLRAQVFGRLNQTISEAQSTAESYSYLAEEMAEVRDGLSKARGAVQRVLSKS